MKSRSPRDKSSLIMTKRNHTTPAETLVWFSFSPVISALRRPLCSNTGCNYSKWSCSMRHCLLSTKYLRDLCGYWLASCSLRLKQECDYFLFLDASGCLLESGSGMWRSLSSFKYLSTFEKGGKSY